VMERDMDRAQKAESIEILKGVFAGAGAVVVTHNMGLSVAELSDLRGRLRKEGAAYKVVKNRLAQKALNGGAGEAAGPLFKAGRHRLCARCGLAAKVATQYAKDTRSSSSSAASWASKCSTPKPSTRWPSCPRSTSCAPSWSA